MSVRWMAVQYVGDVLRLPVVNGGDMDKPFGSSVVEREIRRIVVNPFSDSPQVFVSESEHAKLREDLEDQEGYDQMLRDRLRQQTELHVKAEEENAKLRKLVCDWRELAVVGANSLTDWNHAQADLEQRMRELGVEVD